MKLLNVVFCSLLTILVLVGCSDDKSNNAGQTPEPVKPKIKFEDVKYAGAIVYEFGTSGAFLDSKSHKPISAIYICASRTGELLEGSLAIDLKSLGVAPYRQVSKSLDGEVLTVYELNKLTLNYKIRADIRSFDHYAWGRVEYSGKSTDREWVLTYPDQARSLPDDKDIFALTVTMSKNIADDINYYEAEDGTLYYIKTSLVRLLKEKDDVTAITACEESAEEPVFVKSAVK